MYGKTPEEIPDLLRGFLLILGEESYEDIRGAFIEYLRKNNQMPAPSDIYGIIHPDPPQLSQAYYTKIKRRAVKYYITDDEREYIRRFEKQELDKVRNAK